ncbi:MAG: NAD-dependent 4,6-dehydratase LegB [Bacteroidota bacterium]
MNNRNKKKVLVTGADGFIGSHVVEKLVRKGYDVKAFVMYNSMNSWGWLDYCDPNIARHIEVVAGDIRDLRCVEDAMEHCGSVIHLASLIAIPYSYKAPESYVETNIKGTLNILQAARAVEVERFLHTSTSEVYGTAKYVPIDEKHPLSGQSPYSATKIAADQIAYSFYASFGLPVVTVRPFNTYGPRQSARAIIPTVLSQILDGKKDIKIGYSGATRDFTYIDDTVDGFIAALEATNGVGEVVNLGSNFEISIKDMVELIASIMEKEVNIILDKERIRPIKSEVERLWANNQKALTLFNWKPKYRGVDGFKDGISRTIEWLSVKENFEKYKANIYNI